jgi:hypothetical protein
MKLRCAVLLTWMSLASLPAGSSAQGPVVGEKLPFAPVLSSPNSQAVGPGVIVTVSVPAAAPVAVSAPPTANPRPGAPIPDPVAASPTSTAQGPVSAAANPMPAAPTPAPVSGSPMPAAPASAPAAVYPTRAIDEFWLAPSSPVSIWVRGEYLSWWLKDQALPPLVTTSASQSSLGRLGFSDTSVLYGGDVDGKMRQGFRVTLGGTLVPLSDDGAAAFGVEGSFFLLAQRGNPSSASSNGDTVLARPFLDVLTGQEQVQQIANLRVTDPSGTVLARAVTGRVTVSNPSDLLGSDLHGVLALNGDGPAHADLLVGVRYLYLHERLNIRDDLVQLADPTSGIPQTSFGVVDSFRTRNDFLGGQLGVRTQASVGNVSLELQSKIAIGPTHQSVQIDGSTTATVAGATPVTSSGGLLALPTNMGTYSRDRFTVVPEVALTVGYQFLPNLRGFVGYNFLYWSSVVRPGPQIDTGVNPNYLPPAVVPTTGPIRPGFQGAGSDLWVQGLTLGFELTY